MKKIIISIFFILVAVTAWSQNLKGYQVEALQMLKAKRAFVIGGDTLFSTTQTSGIDTTFVTLEYLRDSLKITEAQIIDFGDYEQKLTFSTGLERTLNTVVNTAIPKTIYSPSNGVLIATDIPNASQTMFTLHIDGNGYNNGNKFEINVQGYNYNPNNSILHYKGHSVNYDLPIYYFIYNGFLHIWLARTGGSQTFNCTVLSNTSPRGTNRITSIDDAVKPTTGVTKEVSFTPEKVWSETNSNLSTVNWSVKDATTQYHAVNKGQLDAIGTKLGTLSTSFIPYWDGTKLANSHLKTVGSVIQYDSEKVFSNPRDIVDKSYVDAIASGNLPKLPVDAATTSNITLSGLQTIDGYSVASGQRVLVKDQTAASQNGVYLAATGTWTRTTDLDSWDELYKAYVAVLSGGQSGSSFVCNIPATGTLETTAITWVLYSASTNIIAGNGLLRVGNVFSADYGGTGSAYSLSRSDHVHTISDITNFPAFGTTAGTIAEGNDSRFLDGQTAFGWGNHADAGYLTSVEFPDETDPIWTAQKVDYYTKTQVNGLLPIVNNPTITFAGTAVVGSPQTITLNQSAAKTITLNAPTVPDQLPSDWEATTGVTRILNKPTLFSGSYVDLTNKPTIPTDNNQLTNGAGYITAAEVTTPTLQSVTDAGAITTKAITALNVTISGTPINANHAVRITDLSNALTDYYTKTQVNGLPVSTFSNNAGYLTTETDPIFTAWDKDYNDLINKPAPIVVAGDSINAHVAGAINGTNNNFTTHANFIAGTTMVYVNGVRQEKGFHYNEGGTTQINFISPYTPKTDERIIIDYKF